MRDFYKQSNQFYKLKVYDWLLTNAHTKSP